MDDNAEYQNMVTYWKSVGQPEYIEYGGGSYRVFTPNGEDQPTFQAQDSNAMYGTTSTSKMAKEPTKRVAPNPNKASDLGD